MTELTTPSNLSQSDGNTEEPDAEIIVVGRKRTTQPSSGVGTSANGAGLSIIAHVGGTNHPDNWISEILRDLLDVQTDYDLDARFTAKQREIIFRALQGLADHPVYGAAMAALAQKNVDINIFADFTQQYTGPDHGRTRAEMMTIMVQ